MSRYHGQHAKVTVIQAYAPTEVAVSEDKDRFYEKLQETIDSIPNYHVKLLLGDFNAQIDGNRRGYESVLGPYGASYSRNDNGERLVSFCCTNGICLGNTLFRHKMIHKRTWTSPDGNTEKELDYIGICNRWRTSLHDVRVFRGADVGSDHHLVLAKVRLKLKRHMTSMKKRPIDCCRLKDRQVEERFQLEISNRFESLHISDQSDVEEQWNSFKDNLIDCAEREIGRRRGRYKERWIKQPTWDLIDLRKEEKRRRDQANSPEARREANQRHRDLDRRVKRSCRRDKREWLEERGREAQEAANRNDLKTLYRIVRELSNSNTGNSNTPIKDPLGNVITNEEDQEARWVEHFRSVLNQPPPIAPYNMQWTGEEAFEVQVNMEEITQMEVKEAITSLKNNKAPGADEISAELLKRGGSTVVVWLTAVFNRMWRNGKVPHEWTKGVIVKVPKKGNLSDCNNWRGITLLSVPGKVFCKVLLTRLKNIDAHLREEQAGFRPGRSCSEQIFTLRNIVEQSIEFQTPVYVNYVDFKKAFDSVHRSSLWEIAASYGVPSHYITLFKSLYENSSCCIQSSRGTSPSFNILSGVKQGCILSPFLFLLVIDFVLKRSLRDGTVGVPWGSQQLCDLDFADDIALLSQKKDSLQEMTNALSHKCTQSGFTNQ